MSNRLELRLDAETLTDLDKYKNNNHFKDRQDAIRNILREKFLSKRMGFFKTLFSIFNKNEK